MKQFYTHRLFWILPLACVMGMSSCKRFPNPFTNQKVLAEVGGERLYLHELTPIFTPDMTAEDSIKVQKSYVDQWVKKQLKVQEAEEMFRSSQEGIDRLVEEYRNSLLTHKVDQYYVDKELDTLFTDKQIADYYLNHKSEFVLDKIILKARVVKLPSSYRQAAKLKERMLAAGNDSYQDFVDICTKNGFELVEINTWSEPTVLLSLLPTDKETDYGYLFNPGQISEFKEGNDIYYVRVTDIRRSGDYAPVESVSEVIKRVLFNQRKQDIIKAHEDSLYRQALSKKQIYVHAN